MARSKQRPQGDQLDILVSHLRAEVGEVITSWTYLREFLAQIDSTATCDLEVDLQNRTLIRLNNLRDRFADEIVARLSELAQQKSGRTNFCSVGRAFPPMATQVQEYRDFVSTHKLHARRNKAISHKQLPAHWFDRNVPDNIEYTTILRTIAMAVSLMKAIDVLHLGPSSPYLWLEIRKRRYTPQHPARHSYMLLPYYHLAGNIRLRIVREEAALGIKVWEPMEGAVNGKKARLIVCKRWGIVKLGRGLLVLEQYPLVELGDIQVS